MPQGVEVQVLSRAQNNNREMHTHFVHLFCAREASRLHGSREDLQAAAIFCEYWRAKSRGGVAAEEAEADESSDQVLSRARE